MSGAKFHGELQLALGNVYCDYLGSVKQLGSHDHVESYAAAANHRDSAAWLNLGAVDCCAHAGGDAAANHGRNVHGNCGAGGNDTCLGDHGVLGEAGYLPHMVDFLAPLMKPAGAVVHVGARGRVIVAKVGST